MMERLRSFTPRGGILRGERTALGCVESAESQVFVAVYGTAGGCRWERGGNEGRGGGMLALVLVVVGRST